MDAHFPPDNFEFVQLEKRTLIDSGCPNTKNGVVMTGYALRGSGGVRIASGHKSLCYTEITIPFGTYLLHICISVLKDREVYIPKSRHFNGTTSI